jgi:hypothetical protein
MHTMITWFGLKIRYDIRPPESLSLSLTSHDLSTTLRICSLSERLFMSQFLCSMRLASCFRFPFQKAIVLLLTSVDRYSRRWPECLMVAMGMKDKQEAKATRRSSGWRFVVDRSHH